MSNVENPQFRNLDRAPYELSHLLVKIGRGDPNESLKQLTDAAEDHASNASGTLLRGLEAIGHLMMYAGTNEQAGDLGSRYVMCIGDLISHIACELQFLGEVDTVAYTAEIIAAANSKQRNVKDKVQS
ncbi:hypothetical protein [Pseudoduganella violaceinigra]|uniref:hypothetical protein n=1 Tax=Pseudoduganella violaceinigra TaxID=246602 RepID=UPI0012B53CF5|nr:hypothetical protein [Pseudoduganella violaceinigra]